jgi:hypothetical protein
VQRIDFYFHEGCPSEHSILLLAKEIEQVCAAWSVRVHPLAGSDVKTLGFAVLPTIAINGRVIASGMPKEAWLLAKIHELEGATH